MKRRATDVRHHEAAAASRIGVTKFHFHPSTEAIRRATGKA
jgi:hypothetical protein